MCDTSPEEIRILAKVPMMIANKYSSYTINGFNFYIELYVKVDLFRIAVLL
jgi:hypothetical protein